MKTETEKLEDRQKLLREQKKAVKQLINDCGSVEAAAGFVGVSPDSFFNWRSGRAVAKGLIRKKLLESMEDGKKTSSPKASKRGGSQPRFDIKQEERKRQEKQLEKLGLAPPSVRVSNLRTLLEQSGLSITALARALALHENTLQNYLNPAYQRLISPSTAVRIQAFKDKIDRNLPGPSSLEDRLKLSLEKLLGAELVDKGFNARDWRRAATAKKISEHTGLHTRTVRRYFPPLNLKNRRIPPHVVEAFEKAAEELGNLLRKI